MSIKNQDSALCLRTGLWRAPAGRLAGDRGDAQRADQTASGGTVRAGGEGVGEAALRGHLPLALVPRLRRVQVFLDRRGVAIDEQADLVGEVAGLPSGYRDDDTDAKQFDLLILRAQLALLRADHDFDRLKKKFVETAALLEELQNVPMVATEMELIPELQTDEFWQDITAPILETVRRRLRELVKLIEGNPRAASTLPKKSWRLFMFSCDKSHTKGDSMTANPMGHGKSIRL